MQNLPFSAILAMPETVRLLVEAFVRGQFDCRPDLLLAAFIECMNASRHRLPPVLDASTRAFLEAGRRVLLLEHRVLCRPVSAADALAWELVGLGPCRARSRRAALPGARVSPVRLRPSPVSALSAPVPVPPARRGGRCGGMLCVDFF